MKERNRGVSAQLNSSHSSVTQPVGDGRNNSRRMEQIETLHLQFEDLKKKIKDVQTKNQEIILNIHKRYDFKKKPQTMQYVGNKTPIVYYEQPQDKSQLSVDNQSNNSNESQCEFKIQKPFVKKTSSIKKNINPSHHQSMEYRKTQHHTQQRQPSQVNSHKANQNQRKNITVNQPFGYGSASQFRPQNIPQDPYQISQFSGMSPYQMSMQFPSFPTVPSGSQVEGFYGGNNSYQFQQAIRRQRQKVRILQKQLQQKEGDTLQLKRLQKKYSNLSLTYGEVIETSMEQFMQEVVKKKLYQIQKFVKKNQNKLRKLHLMIKDKEEQTRSIRNIQEHRFKRSISRSKKQLSPKNASINLPRDPRRNFTSHQSTSLNAESSSASKSKQSEQSKSNMKFQQIAVQYEQMIKVKNKDLEGSQMRLRQKENQLGEMTVKCTKLQLKVAELQQSKTKSKSSKSCDKEENLLGNSLLQSQKDGQIRALSRKLVQFEQFNKKRQFEVKEKDNNIDRLTKKLAQFEGKAKKLEGELKLLKEDKKKSEEIRNKQAQLQVKLRRLESEMAERSKECSLVKDKCVKIENQKIECQCENLTLGNRVKKLQSLLMVRDEKVQELQKIIQSGGGMDIPDLLERSMTLEKMDMNEMHNLQEEKEKLEDLLNQKQEQLYTLQRTSESLEGKFRQSQNQNEAFKKEIQNLQIQNQSMRINLKALQFEKYSVKNEPRSPLQNLLLEEGDCLSEHQEENNLREELEDLRNRYEESQRLLKIQKQQSLDLNSKLIKTNSELRYYRQLLTERQNKYQKLRKEHQESRYQTTQLQQMLQNKENELMEQKRLNNEKLMDLEGQLLQLETGGREHGDDSNNLSQLRQSRNFSEESFANYRSTFNNINAQNEHLIEKLKEAEKVIEIQKEMQSKIMGQYRQNVDKIKGELRDKVKQNEQLLEELDGVKRRVKVLQQNESRLKEVSRGGAKDQLLGLANERASELEVQVAELREINQKMAEMEEELLKQVAEKETENESLVRLIHSKERKIEELEDIIELKQMNISSHITTSNQRSKIKDSQQSQSSLRYSILSNNVVNKDRTMELELSEAGESFFQNNQSMISNVSQVFGREQFPYEKMQLRRVEQRRLFEKTAAYIKSLKHAIQEKNKKIKLLQKKIESLRNSELIRKDIYEMKENLDFEPDDDDVFRDYYSVQLENTHSNRYKLKQLEHQTKLTIEQNNLLNNQIESLQEELLKAEDQQNSLMKLKDLYKDQIKTLIKKNQEQAKAFQEQLKRERQKVEMSESVQKMQAEKQLFVKIVNVIIILQNQSSKSKKKEDRKRQLAEYIKIFFNFVNVEQPIREKMLADLKK